MSTDPDVVRLEEQVKTLYRMVAASDATAAAVRADITRMKEQNNKRVWVGLVTVGSFVLGLLGSIAALVAYIFEKATGP